MNSKLDQKKFDDIYFEGKPMYDKVNGGTFNVVYMREYIDPENDGNRRIFGQWQSSMPSRFIDELPEEHVEVLTASGIYSDTSDFTIHSSNLETEASQADGYNSPGWRRLQNNKKHAALSKPAESRNILVNSNAKSIYEIGERVFHQKFGYGMVIEIEGDKLQIEFEKAGSKRVVSKFVFRPEDIIS